MDSHLVRASIAANARFEFARSSGPGGQNVNKTSTKATARVPLASIEGLSLAERERVAERLSSRTDSEGCLYLSAQDERHQWANRELAIERLARLIEKAAFKPKARIATKATRASRERRLEAKRRAGATKKGRSDKSFRQGE